MEQIDPNMYDGKTEVKIVRAFNNDYYRMNWGEDDPTLAVYNDGYYAVGTNEPWTIGTNTYAYNKWVICDFR